jgi:hypothetical protein
MFRRLIPLSCVAVALAAASLFVCSQVADAQKKRDPAPYVPPGPPAPDVEGFKEAYERTNEPEMIVICGIVRSGERNGERNVQNFDPEGDSDALRRRIEERFLQAHVELIEQSSLEAVKRRELNLLAQQDEGRMIEALKEKFHADLAIRVEMQPRGGEAKYRVTVDTLSAKSAPFPSTGKAATTPVRSKPTATKSRAR